VSIRPEVAFHVVDPGEPVGRRVEIRCPRPYVFRDGTEHPGKMFMVLFLGPGQPDPQAVIELACNLCRKYGDGAKRVLHRYDLEGNLISTYAEHEEK
jgi:hypothetical protein